MAANETQAEPQRLIICVLVAAVVTSIFVAMTAIYYTFPGDRSVFVDAITEEVRIVLEIDATWAFSGATLCREATTRGAVNADADPDDTCGSANMISGDIERVAWQSGASLQIRREGYLAPVVEVLDGNGSTARRGDVEFPLAAGDRLILPAVFGPLAAVGQAELGAKSPAGPPLRSGSFEWRETLPFRERPDIVGTGILRPGDIVRIALGDCESESQQTETLLIYPASLDTLGMGIVLSAADADHAIGDRLGICLVRFGFEPTFIEPKIADRILTDPVIYGLGVILTFAVTVFPATLGIARLVASRRRTNRQSPKPSSDSVIMPDTKPHQNLEPEQPPPPKSRGPGRKKGAKEG